MITKTIKKNPNKKTNLNMTYENITRFINTQNNNKDLLKEMARVKEMASISASAYHSVVAWFEKKFENTDDYKTAFARYSEEKNTTNTCEITPLRKEDLTIIKSENKISC